MIRASRKPSLNGGSGEFTFRINSNIFIYFSRKIHTNFEFKLTHCEVNFDFVQGKGTPAGPPTNVPGQITIQVRVPYRVVGLVVGPKGATIKHIQQQTHTYIVTPSRDKEPVFEVTGLPDNVQSARRQIEAHIALRTGNAATAINGLNSGLLNDMSSSNSGLTSLLNSEDTPEILASLYKNGLGSLFGYLDGANQQELFNNAAVCGNNGMNGKNDISIVNMLPSSAGSSTCSSNSSTSSQSSKSAMMTLPELINIWKRNDITPADIDEGLGDSPQVLQFVQYDFCHITHIAHSFLHSTYYLFFIAGSQTFGQCQHQASSAQVHHQRHPLAQLILYLHHSIAKIMH